MRDRVLVLMPENIETMLNILTSAKIALNEVKSNSSNLTEDQKDNIATATVEVSKIIRVLNEAD